jgi:pyruvate/2-oxoglutarate dehydrogenase complex dihydrolipoamide acyltransferase (E2) component
MENQANLNSDWRKIAAAVYKKPVDSKIFGSVEVDVTDLENWVSDKRRQGIKATTMHVYTLAVARALKTEVPALNAFVVRGSIRARKQIDATVTVLLKENQMGSVKIPDADKLTLSEFIDVFQQEVDKARSGDENKTMKNKAILARIPWPFRSWLFQLLKKLTIGWGFSIPALGLSHNSFGSYLVSNIGTVGLDVGFPALFPTSNVPLVLIVGGVSKKPVVVNDEIVIRRIQSLSVALDHRVVDASHGGLLFRYMKYIIKNPQLLENEL